MLAIGACVAVGVIADDGSVESVILGLVALALARLALRRHAGAGPLQAAPWCGPHASTGSGCGKKSPSP